MEKKIVVFLMLLTLTFVTYAQGPKYTNKKAFSIGVQISNPQRDGQIGWYDIDMESVDNHGVVEKSFSGALITKYGVSEYTNIRLKVGYTKIDVVEKNEYESMTGKQTKLHFAAGAEYRLSIRRASLLYGGDIGYNHHGKYENTYELPGGGYPYYYSVTIPSGKSYGLSALLGFELRLAHTIGLGFEYTPGLYYHKLGGMTSGGTNDPYTEYFKLNNRIFFGVNFVLGSKKITSEEQQTKSNF